MYQGRVGVGMILGPVTTKRFQRIRVSVDPFNDRLQTPGAHRRKKGGSCAQHSRLEGAPCAPPEPPRQTPRVRRTEGFRSRSDDRLCKKSFKPEKKEGGETQIICFGQSQSICPRMRIRADELQRAKQKFFTIKLSVPD